jgi:hypothetical protein
MIKLTRFIGGLLIAATLALLSSCAGSASDQNFRSKVESVELGGNVVADQAGNYGGNGTAKFTFRDPRAQTRDNK